jgi:hypothetical protein
MNTFLSAARRPAPAAQPERQLDATSAYPSVQEIAAVIDQPRRGRGRAADMHVPAAAAGACVGRKPARAAARGHHCQRPRPHRRAVLVPIYKKGDQADISNYRPLSVSLVAWRV